MSYELPRYNPSRHAGAVPNYSQSHVVVGEVPLNHIEFDPRDDELAEIATIGHRVPGSCPRFNQLTADSQEPPIQGAEEQQALSVSCVAYAYAKADPLVYPVCVIKIDRLNIDPERIPTEWLKLTDERYRQFYCPFNYLGAAVVQGQARVKVAITADNPLGVPRFEAV